MNAYILSIGDELITGQTIDTNAPWVAAELTRLGIRPVRHLTVGDDLASVEAAFREALASVSVVLATGGLGPTEDDLTRDGLAAALGVPLHEDAEAIEHIRRYFERMHRTMRESNLRQALVPEGCRTIANPQGTAPGLACTTPTCRVYVLPGVPSEMKHMFAESVAPQLHALSGGTATCIRMLHTIGLTESALGEAIADLMQRGRNPAVGTTADHLIIGVRIVATGPTPRHAAELAEHDVCEVRRRLGTAVFGEGTQTLQETVVGMLLKRNLTIATAESCTGGLFAKRLTDVPGSSACFMQGYITYANEAKVNLLGISMADIQTHGAVSEMVAQAMAHACRERAGVDMAVGITGIAGPSGGTLPDKPVGLVYITVADGSGTSVHRFLFGSHRTRTEIRDRACKAALNLIRLRLLGIPQEPQAANLCAAPKSL